MRKRIARNPIFWYYAIVALRSVDFIGAALVPFFLEWGHISRGTMQLLQMWFWIWTTMLDLPTGVLADRIPRKYAIAGGLFCSALGFALYSRVPQLWVFLIAELILAFGMALISGAEETWLAGILHDSDMGSPVKAGAIAGRANVISCVSRMCTAPLGTLIALYWGLNAPILCAAVPVCIAGCIVLMLPEPVRKKRKATIRDVVRTGLSFVWHTRALKLLTINLALVEVAGYFVVWLYQPLLISSNVPLAYFGIAHAMLAGAQLVVSLSFPIFGRIFGSYERFAKYAALLTFVAFAAPVFHRHILTALFFAAVGGGFGLTRRSALFGVINAYIPRQNDEASGATIRSTMSTVRRAAIAGLNLCVGLLDTYPLRLTLGLLALLPLIAFLMPQSSEKKK
ncbi:MAG: MFS transporter [Candidatus Sungbacteria bacterium]|nr:MFS transporter [Candidatus Sungbacteria bacterium]